MDTSSGIVRVPELDSTATTSLVLSRWFAEKCWYLVLQILEFFILSVLDLRLSSFHVFALTYGGLVLPRQQQFFNLVVLGGSKNLTVSFHIFPFGDDFLRSLYRATGEARKNSS